MHVALVACMSFPIGISSRSIVFSRTVATPESTKFSEVSHERYQYLTVELVVVPTSWCIVFDSSTKALSQTSVVEVCDCPPHDRIHRNPSPTISIRA